jgi:hypothetical protein
MTVVPWRIGSVRARAECKLFVMVFTKSLAASEFGLGPAPTLTWGCRMDEVEIEVDSIEPIGFLDITPQLARESGFLKKLVAAIEDRTRRGPRSLPGRADAHTNPVE